MTIDFNTAFPHRARQTDASRLFSFDQAGASAVAETKEKEECVPKILDFLRKAAASAGETPYKDDTILKSTAAKILSNLPKDVGFGSSLKVSADPEEKVKPAPRVDLPKLAEHLFRKGYRAVSKEVEAAGRQSIIVLEKSQAK